MQEDVSPSQLQLALDQEKEQVQYLLEKLRKEEQYKYKAEEIQRDSDEQQRQLQNEIDVLKEEAAQRGGAVSQLEKQIDEMRYEVAEYEGQLDNAKEDAVNRAREVDRLKRDIKEINIRQQELVSSMEARVKRETDEAYRISAQGYEERMARLMEQNRDLEDQLAQRDYQSDNVDAILAQRDSEFQEQREKYEERIQQLEDQVWNRDQNYYIKEQEHRELLELYHRRDPVSVPERLLQPGYKASIVGRTFRDDGTAFFDHCTSTDTQTNPMCLIEVLSDLPTLSKTDEISVLVQESAQFVHSDIPDLRHLITDTLDEMQRAVEASDATHLNPHQLLAKLLLKVPGYATALGCAVRALAGAALHRDGAEEEIDGLRSELRSKDKDIKALRIRLRELLDKYHKVVQENEFMVQELENMGATLEETEERKRQYKSQASRYAAEAAKLRRELAYVRSFTESNEPQIKANHGSAPQNPPAPATPQQNKVHVSGGNGTNNINSNTSNPRNSSDSLHYRHRSMGAPVGGGGPYSGHHNNQHAQPGPHVSVDRVQHLTNHRGSDIGPGRERYPQHARAHHPPPTQDLHPQQNGAGSTASQDSGSIGASGENVRNERPNGMGNHESQVFSARSALMLRGYQQAGADAVLDVLSTGSSGNIGRNAAPPDPPAAPRQIRPIRVSSFEHGGNPPQADQRNLRRIRSDRDALYGNQPEPVVLDDDDASVEDVNMLRQEFLQVLEQAPDRIQGNPHLRRADLFSMDGLVAVMEWLDGQVAVAGMGEDVQELSWALDTLRSKVEQRGFSVGTARSSTSSGRHGRVTRILQHLQTRETMSRIIEN